MADVEGTGCLGLGPDLLATYDIASGALPDLPVVVQAVAARGLMGVGDSVRRRQEFGREIAAGRLGPPGGVVAGVDDVGCTLDAHAQPALVSYSGGHLLHSANVSLAAATVN